MRFGIFSCSVIAISMLLWCAEARADAGGGSLEFSGADQCYADESSLDIQISGLLAEVTLKQRFVLELNEMDSAVYKLPLGDNSGVHSYQIRNGVRTFKGTVGVVEPASSEDAPNELKVDLGQVNPHFPVESIVHYYQKVQIHGSRFSIDFPKALGSHFFGRCKLNRLRVHASVGAPIASVSCDGLKRINIRRHGSEFDIFAREPDKMDGYFDLGLKWTVNACAAPKAIAHKAGPSGYLFFTVAPEVPKTNVQKEVLFVIDRSQSHLCSLYSRKKLLKEVLDNLDHNTKVNFCLFGDRVCWLYAKSVPLTPKRRQGVLGLLPKLLRGAQSSHLAEAILSTQSRVQRAVGPTKVVLFTDGFSHCEFEIPATIARCKRAPWIVVGDPRISNYRLLDRIVQLTNGDLILNEDAKAISERIAAPVVTDLSVQFERRDSLSVDDAFISTHPSSQVFVNARYTGAGKTIAQVRGRSDGEPFARSVLVILPQRQAVNVAVKRQWALSKIEQSLGRDWAKTATGRIDPAIYTLICKLGVAHEVNSPFTSITTGNPSAVHYSDADRVRAEADAGDFETYGGRGCYFKDDFLGNLYSQISQLIGKWISEFVCGWMADAAQSLTYGLLTLGLFTLGLSVNSSAGTLGLLALNIGISAFILKSLHATVLRRITLCAFAPYSVALMAPALLHFAGYLNCNFLDAALPSAMKGALLIGPGWVMSVFQPLFHIGNIQLNSLSWTLLAVQPMLAECVLCALINLLLFVVDLVFAVAIVTGCLQVLSAPLAILTLGNRRTSPFGEAFFNLAARVMGIIISGGATMFALALFLMPTEWHPWLKLVVVAATLFLNLYISFRLLKLFCLQHFFRRQQIR